jgi:hypothetical protein
VYNFWNCLWVMLHIVSEILVNVFFGYSNISPCMNCHDGSKLQVHSLMNLYADFKPFVIARR